MESTGVIVSRTTIWRRFNEFGVIYKAPITKPLLIQNHRDARLEFAQRSSKTNWNLVIFTDETTFQLFTSKKNFEHYLKEELLFVKSSIPKNCTCGDTLLHQDLERFFFFK